MQDPFVGTWKLNLSKSQFDANHHPSGGTMVIETDPEGGYVMKAEGVTDKGEKVAERPQRLIPDGKQRPVPDFRGLTAVCTRPNPNALETKVRREDGSIVGEAIFEISSDGSLLTGTNSGYDTQLRQFKVRTAWDRV